MATRTQPRPKSAARFDKADLLEIFRLMLLSRRIDDKEIQLKRQNRIFFQISSAGHEAVTVAASRVFRPGYDWSYLYYRDRAYCLGLGMTATEQLLSAVAAADDPNSGGRQMPSHWGHRELRIVSTSSPTGTQFLQAVGAAETWLRASADERTRDLTPGDEVVLCTAGEGTTSEGEFWEALNSACNLALPVVFLIEDNGYAISVPVEVNTAGGSISHLVRSFPNLLVQEVDGCDPLASYDVMLKAHDHARQRKGPALVHATVIRPYSHSLSDDEVQYRPPAEREADAARDPLVTFPRHLIEQGVATEAELELIRTQVDEEVEVATGVALAAPQPTPDTLYRYVYSPDVDPTAEPFDTEDDPQFSGDPTTMVDLLNACLRDELARDPRIMVFGEDVADASREANLSAVKGKGGVFKVTWGLQRQFGGTRVFNSPLAEAEHRRPRHRDGHPRAQAGRRDPVLRLHLAGVHAAAQRIAARCAGARTTRSRPRSSSGSPTAATSRAAPSITRRPARSSSPRSRGCGSSVRPRRSTPTACCAPPSAARTRCSSSSTSTCTGRPTTSRPIPVPNFMIPFGKARVAHPGSDATIITYGAVVQRAVQAARNVAAASGKSAEVIDLRSLNPVDWEAIAESVRRTGRVMVAYEDSLSWGYGAEIAARIAADLFEWLDAPVRRVAATDTFVAYAPELEDVILPQVGTVQTALEELLSY